MVKASKKTHVVLKRAHLRLKALEKQNGLSWFLMPGFAILDLKATLMGQCYLTKQIKGKL